MSLLLAMATVPGMLGTQEAIRQGQQKERREEHRARRCNLIATCIKSSVRAQEINGRPLVLENGTVRPVNSSKCRCRSEKPLMQVRSMSILVPIMLLPVLIDMQATIFHTLIANTKGL